MNTKQEWELPKPLDGETLPSPTDDVAAKLESDLQQERDSRREERFYWVISLTVVINVLIFNALESPWGMLSIFLLQLIGLIGLANWLGVEKVTVLLERLYAKYLNKDD